MKKTTLSILITLLLFTITVQAQPKSGMITTAEPIATQIGLEILKQGGSCIVPYL